MMCKADFKYSFAGFFRWPVLVTLTLIFAASLWLEFRGIDIGLPSRERMEVSLGGEAAMQKKLPEIRQALSNNVAERSEFRDKGDKEYFGELAGFSPYFDQVRTINPDEFHVFKAVVKMKKERTLNPGYYIYGPFYVYQVGAALAAGKVLGVIDSGKGAEYYLSHPEQFAVVYLCGRYLSAIMVSLAVAVTFLIGYRIGRLPLAAFASSLLAFIPIVMLCGKFIKPDSALLFWSSLALLFAIPVLARARWKDYLLTGLFVGLCAATKYPGVFTCSYLVMFHLMRRYSEWRELPAEKRKIFSGSDWKLVAAGGVCCVTFLIVNFAIWADMPTFLHDFKWVLSVSREGNIIVNMFDSLLCYFNDGCFYTWGIPAFAAIVGGIILLILKPEKIWLGMVPVIILFWYTASKGYPTSDAYFIPALLPLSLMAGRLVLYPKNRIAAAALAAVVIIGTFSYSLAYNNAAVMENSRMTAAKWINANIPAGTVLCSTVYPVAYRVPMVSPEKYILKNVNIDGNGVAGTADYFLDSSFEWGQNSFFYRKMFGEDEPPFKWLKKVAEFEATPKAFFGLLPLTRTTRLNMYFEVVRPKMIIYRNTLKTKSSRNKEK